MHKIGSKLYLIGQSVPYTGEVTDYYWNGGIRNVWQLDDGGDATLAKSYMEDGSLNQDEIDSEARLKARHLELEASAVAREKEF